MSKIQFCLQCKFLGGPMPINVFWEIADDSSLAEAFLNIWRLVHATKDSHISSIFHQSLLAFIHHIFFKPTFLLANFLDPSFFGLLSMHYLSRAFHLSWSPFVPNLILWKFYALQIPFHSNSQHFQLPIINL